MNRYIKSWFGVFKLQAHKRPILWDYGHGRQTYATCVNSKDDAHHDWTVECIERRIAHDPDNYCEIHESEALALIEEIKRATTTSI